MKRTLFACSPSSTKFQICHIGEVKRCSKKERGAWQALLAIRSEDGYKSSVFHVVRDGNNNSPISIKGVPLPSQMFYTKRSRFSNFQTVEFRFSGGLDRGVIFVEVA